jgi:hypothetical protein
MSEAISAPGSDSPLRGRTILYYASSDALGPMTDVILARLGYQIVLPEAFETLRAEKPDLQADLLLVDERRLPEVAGEMGGENGHRLPIVLLTGKFGATGDDPRIVGAVKRPAGLHDLYRLMQQIFEDKPRSTPRIQTHLKAHCESRGERWDGRVLSLSENGCLIRSSEAIQLGQKLLLEFALPQAESIVLEAEATYQLLPDTGLVFNALAPSCREALGRFVTQSILA